MSTGHTNTAGDKNSNYAWQKSMSLSQGQITANLTAILAALGGATTNTFFGPIRATGPGILPANTSFSVYNSGTANATFNGSIVKQGEQFSGKSSVAINYDGTGTELVLTYTT